MNIKQSLLNAQNWEDKYRLLIRLGKTLTKPEDLENYTPISGCEVNLWAKIMRNSDRTLTLSAYSEARIMNGLLVILMNEVNGKTVKQLDNFYFSDFFRELGIAQRLSSTRLNGLQQIETLIKEQK
ncbi:SufE family protein [Bisgaard Taxon 10/6]|uniref:SufE family protein n=1 Tax=Exercitatus varius TaxID=67857 RepID=A0AAW6QBA9_9PAST|nr:SufE family protein [Exercitatus varius]MDG2949519.1 SufE family protein [Exercitatus varius]